MVMLAVSSTALAQIPNISGWAGSQKYYQITVPPGQSRLVIKTSGGIGDCDLYVKLGSRPTTGSYNAKSDGWWTNNELVTINNPAQGIWYIMLRGYSAYSGVKLEGQYTAAELKTVVLIHGKTSDQSGYWKQLPTLLTGQGYKVKQFTWEKSSGSLSGKATELNAYINNTGAASVDIVAHSLGVVIFRECIRANPSIRAKINKAVLMAGPSYGVDLDGPAYMFSGLSSSIRSEITPGSAFIWNLHNGGPILSSSKVLQILGGRNISFIPTSMYQDLFYTYGNADGLVASISARVRGFSNERIVNHNHIQMVDRILNTSEQSYQLIRCFLSGAALPSPSSMYEVPYYKGGGLMAKCYDFNSQSLTDPYIQLRKWTGVAYKQYSISRNVSGNSYASDQDWGQLSLTSQPLEAGTYQARRVVWGTSLFLNTVTISDGWMTVLTSLQ